MPLTPRLSHLFFFEQVFLVVYTSPRQVSCMLGFFLPELTLGRALFNGGVEDISE